MPIRLPRFPMFAACAGLLAALSGPLVAETKPFELNMDRVKVSDPKGLAGKTYFVPGVSLIITCSGSVWAQGKSSAFSSDTAVNAQAHGKYYVQGLDKALVQGLAAQVQDDLIAKLRATGATVFTYDDLKADPVVAAHGHDSPDGKWGLPTRSHDGLTYVVAAPSDEQALATSFSGPLFWLRGLVQERKMIAIFPEITFTVPQMWGEKDEGYKRASASIGVNPVMLLQAGQIYVSNPQGSFTGIQIQTHGQRHAAEVAGTVKKLSEDQTNFTSSWGRSSSDWVMTVDPAAFSEGITRVGYAINTMIADQVKKARK